MRSIASLERVLEIRRKVLATAVADLQASRHRLEERLRSCEAARTAMREITLSAKDDAVLEARMRAEQYLHVARADAKDIERIRHQDVPDAEARVRRARQDMRIIERLVERATLAHVAETLRTEQNDADEIARVRGDDR